LGGTDRAAFKTTLPALAAVIPDRPFVIRELVAEGDVVVARFKREMTFASGEKQSGRGLTYYRLANGRIVEDDPITTPDLAQLLGPRLQAAGVGPGGA
jgi:predicted ester cyclase